MHLLFAMTLVFLLYRRSGQAEGLPTPLDYVLLVLGVAPILYLFVNFNYVIDRIFYVDELSWSDMAMGVLLTVLVLEATRRVIGLALPITAVVFLFYAFVIARVTPQNMVDQLYMTVEGIFGIPLAVLGRLRDDLRAVWILHGADRDRAIVHGFRRDHQRDRRRCPAGALRVVGVVRDDFGHAVANVMVDGPITIPLMKRSGFPPHFAAGVEAVASTGGQLMPPIMGAAAFVMAEFLGVSYAQVVIWAIIPSMLYYVACFAAVHFEAKRRGLVGVPRSELPKLGQVMRERGHLFLPVLTILVVMYSGYSAPLAALAGVLACFPVAALRKSTRHYVTFENVIGACVDGARRCAAGRARLRRRGNSNRGSDIDRPRHCLHAVCRSPVAELPAVGAYFHDDRRHRARYGHANHAGLYYHDSASSSRRSSSLVCRFRRRTCSLSISLFSPQSLRRSRLPCMPPPGLPSPNLWATGWAAMRIAATSFIVPFMFVYAPELLMISRVAQHSLGKSVRHHRRVAFFGRIARVFYHSFGTLAQRPSCDCRAVAD